MAIEKFWRLGDVISLGFEWVRIWICSLEQKEEEKKEKKVKKKEERLKRKEHEREEKEVKTISMVNDA